MSADSILDALARRAKDTPDTCAFVVDAESMTFGQLSERAHSLARRLVSAGMSPGDRCAVLLPTSLDFIILVYAVQLARAVPVAIDPSMTPALRESRLRMLSPSLVVTTVTLADAMRQMAALSTPVRDAMAAKGFAWASQEFSLQTVGRLLEKAYTDV